jgi:hypothetical protein
MRRLGAFGLLHFMVFVIYAWCWLCGMENYVYPTCFALESLSITTITCYHQTHLQLLLLDQFLYHSDCLRSLNPKIQQLLTVLRAVYLLHRCCSLSNILPLMLETHTVHFILRHETADISIALAGRYA